jgi:hypothetical protein
MGKFNFRNKKTGKVKVLEMSIAEAEQYEKDHPNLEWICGSPAIGDAHRLGLKKPDDGFRDRLKDIKKSHRGSKINTW